MARQPKPCVCPRCQGTLDSTQVPWHRPFGCPFCARLIEIKPYGSLVAALLALSLVFFALWALGLRWWAALLISLAACLAITNQLLLELTRLRPQLVAFFERSPLDPALPARIEEFAGLASWGEEQDKQLDEIWSLADRRLAYDAIQSIERLKSLLTGTARKRSFLDYVFMFLLFWKVPPPESTISDVRQELLAIASDLRKVEVGSP